MKRILEEIEEWESMSPTDALRQHIDVSCKIYVLLEIL